jgi:uncharacterized FlaG/YvyC family protein
LLALKNLLSENREEIIEAIKHIKKWMKSQKRHVDFSTYPVLKTALFRSRWA